MTNSTNIEVIFICELCKQTGAKHTATDLQLSEINEQRYKQPTWYVKYKLHI